MRKKIQNIQCFNYREQAVQTNLTGRQKIEKVEPVMILEQIRCHTIELEPVMILEPVIME